MEESRTQKLQQILKRLGRAVHGSVIQSKEVRSCLDELHEDGWRAVMLLEASLACRDKDEIDTEDASVRIHIDPARTKISYRIDARDAEILGSLGISPSRHRSGARVPRRDPDDESDR